MIGNDTDPVADRPTSASQVFDGNVDGRDSNLLFATEVYAEPVTPAGGGIR